MHYTYQPEVTDSRYCLYMNIDILWCKPFDRNVSFFYKFQFQTIISLLDFHFFPCQHSSASNYFLLLPLSCPERHAICCMPFVLFIEHNFGRFQAGKIEISPPLKDKLEGPVRTFYLESSKSKQISWSLDSLRMTFLSQPFENHSVFTCNW